MFRKLHPTVGASPGTLVIPKQSPEPRIHKICFSRDGLLESEVTELESLQGVVSTDSVTWIDVQGFGDHSTMQKIGDLFGLHPLLLEDVVNVPQRPHAEVFGDHLLIIVKMVRIEENREVAEQVSIVLCDHYVLTFQESTGDVLDPVRRRLRSGSGVIRTKPAGYLAYAIADTIIDGYYPVLDAIADELELLDEAVLDRPTPELLRQLTTMKNRIVTLRRYLGAQRDTINTMLHEEIPLVTDDLRVYLRDTHSHCVQTAEATEMYRELVSGLMNTYVSAVANRTNEVMKVLTIMSSIFIPLTFLAGVYGMNFEHMPELHVKWAYPAVWAVMACTATGMIAYFWRKGWLGGN